MKQKKPTKTEAIKDENPEEGKGKAKRLFGARVTSLLLLCYMASFLGWIVENTFRAISIGVLDSRHQILPFLLAYGLGIFILFFVLGTPQEMRFFKKRILAENTKRNRIIRECIYFVCVFVLILFGEMGVGLFFEKCFGIVLWHYAHTPLTITKYTSIPTALGFTIGVFLLMRFVFPHALRLMDRIPDKAALIAVISIGLLLLADYCAMIGVMIKKGHAPEYWRIRFR